ncbi:MAG: 4-hydroxy-tetrahydrodipicolinate reductase [Bacteroidia bacterium]|nr:4-hydroxy-tetrahydrodipicolinate reductase [Bacteroidia bacterium]
MNIALIGTGKMGMAVEEQALAGGHQIVLRINHLNRHEFSLADLKKADVAIEFTRPDAVAANLLWCLEAGIPVVSGTTGWHEQWEEVREHFRKEGGSLLTATNFSVGVNIMFQLSRELAAWMNKHPEYHPFLEEVHHTRKLDKPSGTALTLAHDLMQSHEQLKSWALVQGNLELQHDVLPIHSIREGDVIGQHEISWVSPIDKISIRHEAFSRDGFAAGALLAASWLKDKKGVFGMGDVLFGHPDR